jgi:hypothetical protein
MVVAQAIWWVAGLSENKTKPASWSLAELGNKLSKAGGMVARAMRSWLRRLCGWWLNLVKVRLS